MKFQTRKFWEVLIGLFMLWIIVDVIIDRQYESLLFLIPFIAYWIVRLKPNLATKANGYMLGGVSIFIAGIFLFSANIGLDDLIGKILSIFMSGIGLFAVWEGIRIKRGKTT